MPGKIWLRDIRKLSERKFKLSNVTFDFESEKGTVQSQVREVFETGNGATVLLYNKERKTVLLVEQLRIASYLSGNASGMMIETCAGMLDNADPDTAIRKEIAEETGYEISDVKKVMQLFMSPGANKEMLYFYVAEYRDEQKKFDGGGLEDEQEEINVLEVPFAEALQWVEEGKIFDAKTVVLLQYAKLHDLI